MGLILHLPRLLLLALFGLIWSSPLVADWDAGLLRDLTTGSSEVRIAAMGRLMTTGDPRQAETVLKAMAEEGLFQVGDRLLRKEGNQRLDVLTGEVVAGEGGQLVTINNRLRKEIANSLSLLRLFSPERSIRLTAAGALENQATASMVPVMEKALQQENDQDIRDSLTLGLALARLTSKDAEVRLLAVKTLGDSSRPAVKSILTRLLQPGQEAHEAVVRQARQSLDRVNLRLAVGEAVGSLFSGLSLASILLLTALGLAITYGVMGILNMAHGELLMIGAYATYGVQTLFRSHFPQAVDAYLLVAIPVAFLAAALVGILLERTVIRWLYGRPLETLLATWGLSLMLIQTARLLFGAQNVEVANPSWMSGGVTLLPGVVLPWNRLVITLFALMVLALTWLILNRTRLGLFVRAVTQNRPMAGCVGVHTGWVDALAFGLGAGIAGLGGVAISQLANVGPDMGQGYIVDSFLVVVLGGVGQLAGAVWAALGLGLASKWLEGWLGAVIAKILLLVFIIIFIQKRPQGLFVLKGRQVEG
ncbi:MAG: urea ABC transporter permease subunit UrtB [Magnetococcales bacterium]|nr:urea ABC transporter permease subunit UrtB [Magnetococcales bacterium]NGZ25458.1 urea ABC transporter permease subunit UrtB [Magnetococcales bacterium]